MKRHSIALTGMAFVLNCAQAPTHPLEGALEPQDASADADDTGERHDALIEGVETCDLPGVGVVNGSGKCTGALVAPDMIITAAHCFDYLSDEDDNGTPYSFDVNYYPGFCNVLIELPYLIRRYKSWGTALGPDDVALAQLDRPVPSRLQRPFRFRTDMPSAGSMVTILGHGSRAFETTPSDCGSSDFRKARSSFIIDDTVFNNTRRVSGPYYTGSGCPGDSGGPSFVGNNRIFWVTSKAELSGSDVLNSYGEVWRFWASSQIDSKMQDWTCRNGRLFNGTDVGKNDRYPWARHCGADFQNYECDHGIKNWRAVGGTCGDTACQCAGGLAYGDVEIDPATTTCGSTHCGRDRIVYRCRPTGWKPVPGSKCGPP